MKVFPALLLLGVGVPLLAQTPPPKPQPAPAPRTVDGTTQVPLQLVPQTLADLPKDKVVVQVNDVKITAGELDQIIDAYPENTRVFVRGPGRQQFIDQLVRTLVLSEEGKRLKLDQDPTYKVQAQYSLAAILASRMNDDIRKNIKVDDAELKAYYEKHKPEYEKIHARHILIRMAGSPVPVRPGQKDLSDAEALAKANELRAKIKGGADFGEVAKVESDDTGSGSKGGDLGLFAHGQMVPSFEEAAFRLKTGDLSEPVKTQFGYHLILVDERQSKSFDDVKAELEPKVRPELLKKQIDELVNKANVVLDPSFVPASKITK
jgi:peptidyl-prolyl cis-trans isomerase C